MADDNENHTVYLLQEMRGEMQEMNAGLRDVRSDMSVFRGEVNERFDEVNLRMDGLTHMMALLAGNAASHEGRIEALKDIIETPPPQ